MVNINDSRSENPTISDTRTLKARNIIFIKTIPKYWASVNGLMSPNKKILCFKSIAWIAEFELTKIIPNMTNT